MDFSKDEIERSEGPYSTVIIGPNGTGKSEILRIVTNIFRTLHENIELFKNNDELALELYRNSKDYVKSRYSIKYLLDGKEYFYSNKRNTILFKKYDKLGQLRINNEIVSLKKIKLPSTIIASAFLLNDKFVFSDNSTNHIYKYLGLRSSRGSAGTQAIQKKTVNHIINNLNNKKFIFSLSELFEFLGYTKQLIIVYSIRYRQHIFNRGLNVEGFISFFNNWEEIRRRKTEPFSISYFKENISKNRDVIISIVEAINNLAFESMLYEKGQNLEFDIFEDPSIIEKVKLLDLLVKLDLLRSPKIELKKNESYSLSNSSSGEYHFIISMIGLLANIKNNSLICIDEPDTSLHPNWQMKYINFLKKIFKDYSTSQFIIATHSHFMVSDLEPSSSHLIGLKREEEEGTIQNVELPQNTYGWSAEEILYAIFNVRSMRNSFLEYDLTKLIAMMNNNSKDFSEIKRILNKINELKLSEGDPLLIIIEKAEKYIEDNNA